MAAIWTDEAKLARWLEVELAAVEAFAEAGVVPSEDAEALRAKAVPPTPERVAEIERITHHDLAAFVDAVAEQVGPVGRWLHYGLTSSDVLDTALALQLHAAGQLILDGIDAAISAVVRRAVEHRDTAMVGRTHGVHAEAITFGVKLAAAGSAARSTGFGSGSSRAPSASTRARHRTSSDSSASGSGSSRSRPPPRWCPATASRSCSPRLRCAHLRSNASRLRSDTSRGPRSAR
jgi:hypothetical protein